jgi:hypothetical protein
MNEGEKFCDVDKLMAATSEQAGTNSSRPCSENKLHRTRRTVIRSLERSGVVDAASRIEDWRVVVAIVGIWKRIPVDWSGHCVGCCADAQPYKCTRSNTDSSSSQTRSHVT